MYRVGIDVGGTFTDFVIYDEKRKKIDIFKIPSDKNTPWSPITRGLKKEIKDKNRISDIRHGSTIGINAVIERKGSRTALLTTKGFRDLLEIARQKRPYLYDLHIKRPPPIIPRHLRIPITERIDRDGNNIILLREDEVLDSINKFKDEKIESVAILFLHSYANGANEKKAELILKKILPEVYISASSRVICEFREYERLATTTVNAYIGPVFKRYLENLLSELGKIKIKAPLYICQSDGGLISPKSALELPVRTLFSGPSAGVAGASFLYGNSKHNGNLITLDMGGTSTDVAIISKSKPTKTTEKEVMGYPVKFPVIDVLTIGAGGGSIAGVDEGGFLKVGPESSGADPGPACYDKGGEKPTVTDANLILGTLGVKTMLGGKIELNLDEAKKAIENLVSLPLKISVREGAWAIVRLIISNISEAIRKISISKGFHPKDLKLIAYGGAGPMHAALVAKELGIKEVIIPKNPGAFSAEGLLCADVTMDFVKTIKGMENKSFNRVILDFKNKAKDWFKKENISQDKQKLEWSLDIRYEGQNYEINIPVLEEGIAGLDRYKLNKIKEIFHKKHSSIYGYKLRERRIEIINLRLRCIGILSIKFKNEVYKSQKEGGKLIREFREVYFVKNKKSIKTPVYNRSSIPCNYKIEGPAIIEQVDSTIVIPPGDKGGVGSDGSFIISVK